MGFSLPGRKTLKTGAEIARYAIPADVRDEYRRLYGKRREERWRGEPGTSRDERKRSYGEFVAEISGRIEAIRATRRGDGIDLSRTQAAALAGEWYRWFCAHCENDPGRPEHWDHEFWRFVDGMQRFAPDEVRAQPMRDLEWSRDPKIRAGIRPLVADVGNTAQFLASRGVTLTNPSQAVFLDFVVDNYVAALNLLERRARNDYSPDETAETFPKFDGGLQQGNDQDKSPWRLFEAWQAARQPAIATVERWRWVFLDLERTFAGPEAQRLTEDTAQSWAKSKITDERSPKTVRETWVSAAHTVYAWAKSERMLGSNPFADVSVAVPRKIINRESKAFSAEEARTILRAAMTVDDRASAFAAAKRWVPWLSAYSGARAGELTQLRGQDIEQRRQAWVMRIRPDAGTVKTGEARTVPLHEHIIEQGFLDYVQRRGRGPLFYDPETTDVPSDPMKPKKPKAVEARAALGRWVRSEDGFGARGRTVWVFEDADLPLLDLLKDHLSAGDFRSQAEIADFFGKSPPMARVYIDRGIRAGVFTMEQVDGWIATGKWKRKRGLTEAPVRPDASWRNEKLEETTSSGEEGEIPF
jgi:integrase